MPQNKRLGEKKKWNGFNTTKKKKKGKRSSILINSLFLSDVTILLHNPTGLFI